MFHHLGNNSKNNEQKSSNSTKDNIPFLKAYEQDITPAEHEEREHTDNIPPAFSNQSSASKIVIGSPPASSNHPLGVNTSKAQFEELMKQKLQEKKDQSKSPVDIAAVNLSSPLKSKSRTNIISSDKKTKVVRNSFGNMGGDNNHDGDHSGDSPFVTCGGTVLENIADCKLLDAPSEVKLRTDLSDVEGYHSKAPFLTPTVEDQRDAVAICDAINQFSGGRGAFGPYVNPLGSITRIGCIGIYSHNGKIRAIHDGRWALPLFSRTAWVKHNVQLDSDVYEHETLLMVRVAPGKIGKICNNGEKQLLAQGRHVFNDGMVTFEGFEDIGAAHIQHGNFNVVRVPRGKYAKAWVNNEEGSLVPRVLHEGLHCIENPQFKIDGYARVEEEYIKHGALHILQIPKGRIAKVFHDNRPRLLSEGTHIIESTNFQYCGQVSMGDKIFQHGTITIVRVNLGEIGVCWENNVPKFIDQSGIYAFDSPDFQFVRHVPANERVVELGAKKIIMVYTGEVGISYDHGELRVMNHGRHIIDASNVIFDGFLSTQQKSLRLLTLSHSEKKQLRDKKQSLRDQVKANDFADDTADLLVCETKDLVKVGVRADVFYSIEDPAKAISRIKSSEIEDLIRETAIATLTNIIRATALNEIAQSKQPHAQSEDGAEEAIVKAQAVGNPSAPLFFDKAHDEFLSKLHDDFMKRYGLDIANIRIESFKIMDEDLADSISKQALVTAQTENELANLQGKTQIATAEQHRIAEVQWIQAQSDAKSLKMKTDAENMRLIEAAKAEAEAARIATLRQAEAEADAIRIKAQAEAEAIALIAKAKADEAQMLSKTAIGQQLSLLNVYAEMMAKVNQGVEKVVYCDPTLAQNGSPFNFSALSKLNDDLQNLQGINKNGSSSETSSTMA